MRNSLLLAGIAIATATAAEGAGKHTPAHRVASPSSPAPCTAPGDQLGVKDLDCAGAAIATWHGKDQFDVAPNGHQLLGKKVVVEKAIEDIGPSTFWRYDASTQKLTIGFDQARFTKLELLGDKVADTGPLYGITLERTAKLDREYAASNAFGAVAKVSEYSGRALAVVSSRPGGEGAFRDEAPTQRSLSMAPDAARQYVRGLRLRVSGTVSAFPDGRVIVCAGDYSEPTITNPIERSITNCVVGLSEVTSTIVDGAGKVVLDSSVPRYAYAERLTNPRFDAFYGEEDPGKAFTIFGAPVGATATVECAAEYAGLLQDCEVVSASPDDPKVRQAAASAAGMRHLAEPPGGWDSVKGMIVTISLRAVPE